MATMIIMMNMLKITIMCMCVMYGYVYIYIHIYLQSMYICMLLRSALLERLFKTHVSVNHTDIYIYI